MGRIRAPRGVPSLWRLAHTWQQKCRVTQTPPLTAPWPQAHGDGVTSCHHTWGLP